MSVPACNMTLTGSGFAVTIAVLGSLLIAPLTSRAQDAGEIAIEQVEWGFDGKAVIRTFVPLSVLISNPSPAPAEGTLRLTRAVQLTQQVGAVCEEDYYVSPGESRWVQFTPYVLGDWESWSLSWGATREQRMDISTPRLGEPAVVLIDDPDDVDRGSSGVLRRFNEALFPISVTGTDGLEAVVLDHAPHWQGARAQAFLDWLRRGGRAYVIYGPDGRFPEFPSDLNPLNAAADRSRFGAGLVKRLPLHPAELNRVTADTQIINDERPKPTRALSTSASPFGPGGMLGWDRDRQLFIDLESLARFHRNWWLVYASVLLYLLTMYPGCYLLGRNVPNVRVFYSGFFGATIVFSLLFAWLGQIGSSEVNRVRSAATAYQLEDGLYDVAQWSSVAVVDGGIYELQHRGAGRLYSTCQEVEAVNGAITTGANGGLTLDMPPVSTRTVLTRMRLSARPLGLRVDAVGANGRTLSSLALSAGEQFPRDVEAAWAIYRGRVYPLDVAGKRLALKDRGIPTASFLNDFLVPEQMRAWVPSQDVEELSDEELIFHNMQRTLAGNSFGLRNRAFVDELIRPADLLRVLVYAPLPPEFSLTGDAFPDQQGRVLYVVDLPVAYNPLLDPLLESGE